jgi:hypothetical protein
LATAAGEVSCHAVEEGRLPPVERPVEHVVAPPVSES